jgi:hypothetical protein
MMQTFISSKKKKLKELSARKVSAAISSVEKTRPGQGGFYESSFRM